MTAIVEVSAYLPAAGTDVGVIARGFGADEKEIRAYKRYFGLERVRFEPGGTAGDLMLGAAAKLDTLRGRERDVRYVLQARTTETIAPYPASPLREARLALGLEHATAFTVTQHACASGLLAVSLAGRLLAAEAEPGALALVFTGEKTFTQSIRRIPNTTFMGEGCAAVLVSAEADHDRLLGYATRTHGRFYEGERMSAELNAEFEDGYLGALAEVISAALDLAGVDMDGLRLVLPHNVNRLSWLKLCKRTGLPIERVLLDNLGDIGHCFCADSFINYTTATELGLLRQGDRYLMTAVGIGATFSAMVFEH